MHLTIDEKRILLRFLEKTKPANTREIALINRLAKESQYEIDSEQASIMFPVNKIAYMHQNTLLKAA